METKIYLLDKFVAMYPFRRIYKNELRN